MHDASLEVDTVPDAMISSETARTLPNRAFMKGCRFLLVTLFTLAELEAREVHGWEETLAHREGQSELKILPRVLLIGIKENVAEIHITNISRETLTYRGTSADSPTKF